MRLEPKDRRCDTIPEKHVLEILREWNGRGCSAVYTKTFNFYKYQINVDTEVHQYRVAISHPYRHALQIELIGNNLNHILDELTEWTATI